MMPFCRICRARLFGFDWAAPVAVRMAPVMSDPKEVRKRGSPPQPTPVLEEFDFSSTLPASLRSELEELFFFNHLQRRHRKGIVAAVEQIGNPTIVQEGERIWIGTLSGGTQCLFARGVLKATGRLLGAVLFGRPDPDLIRIWHIAVAHEGIGRNQRIQVGSALVEKVRITAHAIKGVNRIRLPYSNGRFLRVRLPGGP
jgi:hypothetical protein